MSYLIIKTAETSKEITEAYKVRYKVFCQEIGILDPSDSPKEQETDVYDKRSTQFIATRAEKVIATARLILPADNSPLPSEIDYSFPAVYDTEKTVEFSRGSLLKEYRNMLGVTIKVLDYMYEYCKDHGISYVLALANYEMYLLYKKLNLPFVFVDEPIDYKGFRTVPLVFRVEKNMHILKKKR